MLYEKNTRDIWLEELSEKSEIILKYLSKKDKLTSKEQHLADLCAGFIYLKGVCESNDFLGEPESDYFENVTIH